MLILQIYILLGSVEDVIVPEWLNNEKILEIYKEISLISGEWCERAVNELCEYYKINRNNLNELFGSEKGREALGKFTEIYKMINEIERKKIFEKFGIENEMFEAATFRARFGKDKSESLIKEYDSIQNEIEKSINAVLT